jgi:hypothetical protein
VLLKARSAALHNVYLMAGQEYAACAEIGAAKNITAINTAKTPEIRRKKLSIRYCCNIRKKHITSAS